MRNWIYKLPVAAAACLMAGQVLAADVRMSVEPEIISLLDRAVLKIEFVDTKGDAAEIPDVDGLRIDYRGQQWSSNIMNGRSSSSVTHTYLITPTKVGDYTIGPVRLKYNGGERELTAHLRVIKPPDDTEAQNIDQIMYSRISTDREQPFVHEPFGLTLKVYVRDGIQTDGNFSIRGGLPDTGMDGELDWEIVRREREEHDGIIYKVYTLRATAKALTAGRFSFSPEIQLNVVVPRQQRRSYGFDDPFFGDFFGRQETRPIRLDCNTLAVDVRPIPLEGRPESFTGGVGKMDFDVTVGPKKLKAGEPVTLKMRISGTGNLEKITPPHLKEHPGIKLYDVNSVPTENPNEVLFEQVVIPTSETIKELPAISFSYFNTQTTDFRTETRGPFPIDVAAAPHSAAAVMSDPSVPARQETEVLGHDIAYLKPHPAQWQRANEPRLYETMWFRGVLALPLLLLAMAGMISRHRSRLEKDTALARRQKAPKAARQHIQLAEQAIRNGDAHAFYEALWNALASYFGHRLNLPPGQVAPHTVLNRIPGDTEALAVLFNTIEQRRYGMDSGSDDAGEMKALLKQLTAALKQCERSKL